jgi:hypothetical protein
MLGNIQSATALSSPTRAAPSYSPLQAFARRLYVAEPDTVWLEYLRGAEQLLRLVKLGELDAADALDVMRHEARKYFDLTDLPGKRLIQAVCLVIKRAGARDEQRRRAR